MSVRVEGNELPELNGSTPQAGSPDLDFARTETVRYQRPELPGIEEIARYYALAEEARFYSNGGPCCERLASRLSEYLGGASCVPVANCTAGLMAALREVCGDPIQGRNLIAVPSFTFTATGCAISWAGFEPLFVDIDADSWQMQVDALAEALERHDGRVAGVMGCSTFGTAAPVQTREGWRGACQEFGLPLLLDSAAGFGAVDEHGRRLGSLGDIEIFSFHATKPFAIGEGGAIATPDPDTAERLARIVNFGIDPRIGASVVAGLNAKMSELHAACGLAMLDRFDDSIARRRATAVSLQDEFAPYPVVYQAGSAGSTWQVLQLLVPDVSTRGKALELAERFGIEVRSCFDPPLHRQPAFANAATGGELSVTDEIAGRSLSLPMANTLGPRQIARLAHLINAVFEG